MTFPAFPSPPQTNPSGGGGGGGPDVDTDIDDRPQRSITTSGNLPLVSNDSVLNINSGSDLTPVVLLASSRSGASFTFKNKVGSHLQTITATSPDTFDGAATYTLAPGASVTLRPYNDGVNSGYAIE